jgi:hypothetical protein
MIGHTLDGDDVQRERVVATTTMRGYEVSGGGESVAPGGTWHQGEAYPEHPSTLHSAEVEEHNWFGSYELKEPGR